MNNALIPSSEEIKAIEVMAKYAQDSKFFNNLGGLPGIFSIMLYAKEIGMPPMQAVMGGMTNIMGRVQLSPQLMNAMIRKAGHKLDIQSDETKCTIKGTRKDTGETCTVGFSVEDAKRAGIFKTGGGWDKYPSDMCFARALSRIARRLFPDVIGMSYVEGEVDEKKHEIKEEPQETIEVQPVKEDLISTEELVTIVESIGDREELRSKILTWLSVDALAAIPKKSYNKVLKAIDKYKDAETKKDEQTT